MSKLKLASLISAICLMGLIFYGMTGFSQSQKQTVRLTTVPPLSQVLPFEAEATRSSLGSGKVQSPVLLTLQAKDSQGQSLNNAKIHLQILTPRKNLWFSTDFPMVEGTKLLDIEGIAPTGKLQVQQVLPIRGTYQLLVQVTPIVANAFVPMQQTLTLKVPENPLKYRYFGFLVVILLAVGLGGGWILGGEQKIGFGEIAPQRVRLLLSGVIVVAIASLLIVNISAEMAESEMSHHGHVAAKAESEMSHHHHEVAKVDNSGIIKSQGMEVQLSGDEGTTVGTAANLQAKVIDTQTNQPVTDVNLKIKTTQIEDSWVAFAYQGVPDATGQLSWQQGFFDGAPHNIEVEVSPQPNSTRKFQPFWVRREIEVEGVAPPLLVRLISLAYFSAIALFGLVLGLWLRKRWVSPRQADKG
jgi:hypothetical protein